MPIDFKCPSCQATIRVSDNNAGRKGNCPSCKTQVRVPGTYVKSGTSGSNEKVMSGARPAAKSGESAKVSSQPATETGASANAASSPPAPKSGTAAKVEAPPPAPPATAAMPAPAFIKFSCPACNKATGFPPNMAGAPAPCPICGARIMVPQQSGEESFVVGSRKAPTVDAAAPPAGAGEARTPTWFYAVAGGAVAVIAISVVILVLRGNNNTVATAPSIPAQNIPQVPVATTPAIPAAIAQAGQTARPSIDSEPQTAAPAEKKDAQPAPAPAKEPAPAKTEEPNAAFAGKNAPPEKTPADPDTTEKLKEPAKEIAEKKPVPKALADDDDQDTEGRISKPKAVAAAKDAADNGDEAKQKATNTAAAKPAETQPAPVKPVAPPAPAPLCQQCLGVGTLPLSPMKIYVRTGSEAITAATAANSVPWRLCPRCGAKIDPQTLVATETARLEAAPLMHKHWEELASVKLTFAETHHVTLRSTMSEADLKIVASALEQLTSQLQQSTGSTILTQTRPDTDQILIGADKAGYWNFIDALKALDPKEDWSLSKASTGFMTPHMAVFDAQRGGGSGARSMALYELGEMLIIRATNGKAPTWLRLGFASYCENMITKKNLVYAFAYEKNEVHFSENWDNEIKKYASQSKLKTWDQIYNVNMIGMSSLDYLTCYSMVNFFLSTDPKLFPKLLIAYRDGLDTEKALQKVYSSDTQRMQNMWAQWAMSK